MRLTILFFFLSSFPATAQIRFWASLGYGTYALGDIKGLQSEFVADYPVDLQVTQDFPGYWNYELGGEKVIDSTFFVGACLAYGTTAGRLQYTDYSGSATADQLLSYFSIGVPLGMFLNPNSKHYKLTFDLRPAIVFSSMDLEFETTVGGQIANESFGFNSLNLSIQPTIGLRRKFSSLVFSIDAGYQLTLYSGKVYLDTNSEAFLLDKNGDEIKIDWSGLRVSAGIGMVF